MHVDFRRFVSWCLDLAIAYAGGLILGAPFALVSVRLTGIEVAAPICMVMAMAVLFVMLRRAAAHRRASGPGASGDPTLESADATGRRRVA